MFKKLSSILGQSDAEQFQLAEDTCYPLEIHGLGDKLVISVHDCRDTEVSETIKRDTIWEPDETALLVNLLKKNQTVLDIGANIGYFSLIAASLVGAQGQVLAFEPDPTNYGLLKKNIRLNQQSQILPVQVALSNESSEGFLYLNADNLGDHQLFAKDNDREKVKISIKRGDDALPSRMISVDFIKIDTQGSEFHALQGLAATISNSLPTLTMLLEFWPNGLRQSGISGHQLLDLLMGFQFEFYLLKHSSLIPISYEQLAKWIDVTQMDIKSDGFINLLCSGADIIPQKGWKDLPVIDRDPLDILLGGALELWDGHTNYGDKAGEFIYLKKGWELPSTAGIVMEEPEALINFSPVPPMNDKSIVQLEFKGLYKGHSEPLEVYINEQLLGTFDLTTRTIDFSSKLFQSDMISIKIRELLSKQDSPKYCLVSIGWKYS
ncbi:MAG: FkbM family methyltransferase [Paraglaciecola sp.]|jgi:FkbM family methyltransferase